MKDKNGTAVYICTVHSTKCHKFFFYISAYINSYLSPSKYLFTLMRQAFRTVFRTGPEIVFGQYIKKVRLILEKIRPISIKGRCNIHTKGQFKMKLKFFFVSKSVSVPLNKELP
jgi:hypothetical protein